VKEVNQIRDIFAAYAIEMAELNPDNLILCGIKGETYVRGTHNTITSSARAIHE
jgi:hypothetical protein